MVLLRVYRYEGRHFVGDYYVRFDKEYKAEIKALMEKEGMEEEEAKKKAPILLEAQGNAA